MGNGILTWLLWLTPVVGAVAVYRGWRGRRVGTEPRCARCEYILAGSSSPQCPECGTERLPETTVHGEHRKRPPLLILGVALLLVSAGMGVRLGARQAGWYGRLPTWWVISELGHNPDAVGEIKTRIAAGQLSDGQWQRLIERALAEQTAARPDGTVVDLLDAAMAAGKLLPEQCQRLLDQGIEPTIRTRNPLGEGATLHATVGIKSQCPGWATTRTLWISYRLDKVECDGEDKGVSGLGMVGGFGISDGRGGVTLNLGPAGARGKHRVRVAGHVDLTSGPVVTPSGGTVLATRKVVAETTYEVVAPELAPAIKVISGPEFDKQFRQGLEITGLQYTKQGQLKGELIVQGIPFPIALKALVNDPDGNERVLGGGSQSGTPSIFHLPLSAAWPDSPSRKVTVVVRSSTDAAAENLDMDKVYVGEVELKDVPVEVK